MAGEKEKWKSAAVAITELPTIYEFSDRPLEAGLWCLYVSKHVFETDYLLSNDIEYILQEYLDVPVKALGITRAFARAGKRVIAAPHGGGYKISSPGEEYLKALKSNEPLNVVYINPNKPRTARKDLESLIRSIPKDDLMICDPYYGIRTLEVLEAFAKHHKSIKFLTSRVGGGEKQPLLSSAIADFKKEYGTVELRSSSGKDLHDRYIIAKGHFFIIGHGIKDLGSKESLIVAVEDKYGRDIRLTIAKNFGARWASGTPL